MSIASDDFGKYEILRDKGTNPLEVCKIARLDNIKGIKLILMLRRVFGLSHSDAKKVTILASGTTLEEHANNIIRALEELAQDDLPDNPR